MPTSHDDKTVIDFNSDGELQSQKFCLTCGTPCVLDAVLCSHCGQSFKQNPSAVQQNHVAPTTSYYDSPFFFAPFNRRTARLTHGIASEALNSVDPIVSNVFGFIIASLVLGFILYAVVTSCIASSQYPFPTKTPIVSTLQPSR